MLSSPTLSARRDEVYKQGRTSRSLIPQNTDIVFDLIASYLPAIGRFLIVVTFIEDSLRIITQWSDQLVYLREYRKSKRP
jgi:hypothetical protein